MGSLNNKGDDASLHNKESDMWIWTSASWILLQPKYWVMLFKDSGGICFGFTMIVVCKQVQYLGAKRVMMTRTLRRASMVIDE